MAPDRFVSKPGSRAKDLNFQPFARKREVSPGGDEDMTREPEMVQAYRDTWELGLHSYLSYMRDRPSLARELLVTSGNIFAQMIYDNTHKLNDHRLEAGGFISRLKARPSVRQNRITWLPANPKTLANHGPLQALKPHDRGFNDADASPDVLEVVA